MVVFAAFDGNGFMRQLCVYLTLGKKRNTRAPLITYLSTGRGTKVFLMFSTYCLQNKSGVPENLLKWGKKIVG